MDIQALIRNNRRPRKQKGQLIETDTAFFLRYYVTVDGARQKKCVKLANKSETYRTKEDVAPLVARELESVNEREKPTGSLTLTQFVEEKYLPWCEANKAAATAIGYRRLWEIRWKRHIGHVSLVNLRTEDVTGVLTDCAKQGFGRRTLSHSKWMLSGVYGYAAAIGAVPNGCNPVAEAKWLCKVVRPAEQKEYTLDQVLSMLKILEPVDLRSAVAVGLAYFAALRPAEIRGLMWDDFTGDELHVRRSIWRRFRGDTKTETSDSSVPVIEPLRGLIERLGALTGKQGFILQNASHNPLDLDSLNSRVIAPALKKAGIPWAGYYPGRRGINSLVLDTSKNVLNSSGLLRNAPVTNLKHYTRAQKESIRRALEHVEEMARRKD